ncbi:hypothetical protein F5X68DRAFT_228446 [Plectosphaerella plurivora]|uniref:Uncharacterized protein n=1 Tax=Plectosphaerella plurivora TaxID=936078 RepID=A0A9P8VKU8_9PEZI|nr:hypothetical protein F5X68DRAFT_228446 [Plectosphaerella plurivora]
MTSEDAARTMPIRMLAERLIKQALDECRARANVRDLKEDPNYTDWVAVTNDNVFATIDHCMKQVIVPHDPVGPLPVETQDLAEGLRLRKKNNALILKAYTSPQIYGLLHLLKWEIKKHCKEEFASPMLLTDPPMDDSVDMFDDNDRFVDHAAEQRMAEFISTANMEEKRLRNFKALPSFHHFWVFIAYIDSEGETCSSMHYFPKNVEHREFFAKIHLLYVKNVPEKNGVSLERTLAECHKGADFILECLGEHMSLLQQAEARRIKNLLVKYGKTLKNEYAVRVSYAQDTGPAISKGQWETVDSFVGGRIFRDVMAKLRQRNGHRDDIRLYIRKSWQPQLAESARAIDLLQKEVFKTMSRHFDSGNCLLVQV